MKNNGVCDKSIFPDLFIAESKHLHGMLESTSSIEKLLL